MVVVYKTATLKAVWVQIRSLRCELCGERFRYLAQGYLTVSTAGLPIIHRDDEMKATVLRHLERDLASIAKRDRAGQAACPHCGRYQAWMVADLRKTALLVGLIAGPALGCLLGGIWSAGVMLASDGRRSSMGAVIAGTLIGLALGYWGAKRYVPGPPAPDRRAMRDEEFERLASSCRSLRQDCALAWYGSLGNTLGATDPVFPLELREA